MDNSTTVVEVDRISDLPDELLSRVLSFLTTKQAFSTTILSKRWAPLYRSLTHLRFDDESVADEQAFLRFRRYVDTVTLSTHVIKTIHFKCRSKYWRQGGRFTVDRWIENVKRHPVEKIKVVGGGHDRVHMGSSIFSSFPTLVVLKLKWVMVVGNVNSVHLPLLKTLHLSFVCFKNLESLDKLVHDCPNLEDAEACISYLE